MDQNTFDERTFAGILKTILLFLENYNFAETSQCFANEIKTRCKNQEFDDIVPRTLVLKRLSGELDKIVVTVTDSNEEKTLKVHRLCDVCSKDKKVSNVEDVELLTETLNKLKDEHLKLINIATQFGSILGLSEDKGVCARCETPDAVKSCKKCKEGKSGNEGEESENFIPLETKQVSKDIPAEMSMPLLQMEEKDSMISSLHEELKSLIMNSVMSAAVLADEAAGSKSDPTPCADDETEVTDSQSTPQEMLDVPYYDSPRRSSKSPKGGSRTSSPRKSGSRSPSKSSSPNLSTSKSTPSPGLQSPTKKSSSLVHSPKKSKVKCCPNPKCENPNALTTVEEFNHSGGSPSDSMNNLLHNVDYSKTCSRLIMQAKSLQMPNHPSITDSLALDDFPYNPDCNCDFTQNVSAFQGIDRAEKDESSSPRRSSPTKQSPSNLSSPSNEAGSPRRSTSKSPTKLSTRGDSSAKMSSADSPARTSKQTCCDNPNCENPTATRIPSTDLENVKSMIKACSRSKSMMIQSQMSDLEGVAFNIECKCDYTPVSSPIGNEAQSPRRSTSKSPTKLSTGGDSSSVKMSSADSPARTSKQTCCKHPKCENPEADLGNLDPDNVLGLKEMLKSCSRSKSTMLQKSILFDEAVFNANCKCDYSPFGSSSKIEEEAYEDEESQDQSSPMKISSNSSKSKQICCQHPECEDPEAAYLATITQLDPDNVLGLEEMVKICSRSRSIMKKTGVPLEETPYNPDCKCDSRLRDTEDGDVEVMSSSRINKKQTCCRYKSCKRKPDMYTVTEQNLLSELHTKVCKCDCDESNTDLLRNQLARRTTSLENLLSDQFSSQNETTSPPSTSPSPASSPKKMSSQNVSSPMKMSASPTKISSTHSSAHSSPTRMSPTKISSSALPSPSKTPSPVASSPAKSVSPVLASPTKMSSPTVTSPTKLSSQVIAEIAVQKCCVNPEFASQGHLMMEIDPKKMITLESMMKSCKNYMSKTLGLNQDGTPFNAECKCDLIEALKLDASQIEATTSNADEEVSQCDSEMQQPEESQSPVKEVSKRSLSNDASRKSSKSESSSKSSKSKVASSQMSKLNSMSSPRKNSALNENGETDRGSRSQSGSSRERVKSSEGGKRRSSHGGSGGGGSATDRTMSNAIKKLESLTEEEAGEGDQPGGYFRLDYDLIKKDLKEGKSLKKLGLLQALRWRLTKSDREVRDEVLAKYTKNDILDLADSNFKLTGDFLHLTGICKGLEKTYQEEMARFVNCLASTNVGRKYLMKNPNFLADIMLPMLITKIYDPITRFTKDFILAIIQKLSVNSDVRKVLLNDGILDWLVDYIIDNHATLNNYSADYSTALLANMCLEEEARSTFISMDKEKIFKMLQVLVETPHECCVPYLNAIFYSLLGKREINTYAMDNYLTPALVRLSSRMSDDESRNQLKMIIQVHTSISFVEVSMNDLAAPDEQVQADSLEKELEMNDPVTLDPSGEEFLLPYKTRKTSVRNTFMSDSGITDSKLSASKFGTAGDGGGGGGFGHCDMPCPGFAAASAAAGRDCDGNILSGGKNGSRRSRSKGGRHGDRSRSQSGSSDRSKKRTKKNDGLSIGLENTACIKKAIELDSGGKTIKCTYDPCKFDCYDFYYCDPMMNICQRQNFSCDCYSNIQDFISDDSRMCPTPERNCTMFCSDDCNRSSLFNNCNNCNYPGF